MKRIRINHGIQFIFSMGSRSAMVTELPHQFQVFIRKLKIQNQQHQSSILQIPFRPMERIRLLPYKRRHRILRKRQRLAIILKYLVSVYHQAISLLLVLQLMPQLVGSRYQTIRRCIFNLMFTIYTTFTTIFK